MRFWLLLLAVLVSSLQTVAVAQETDVVESHGLSIWDSFKYDAGFQAFEYVNPAAPKGGSVVYGAIGTFDSLRPFILRGTLASSVALGVETLMKASFEEPATSYGLLAERVRYKTDGTWIEFDLKEHAKFQDGSSILAKDVAWTFETLISKGDPVYRYYYQDVERVEVRSERRVRFYNKNPDNAELFYILGSLPVLSSAWWEGKEFGKPGLDMPLGSGPYRLKSFEAGKYLEWTLDENYWGKNENVNVGIHNFGTVRYDYYRDETVIFAAFLAGKIDLRSEYSSKNWHTGYDIPALSDGRLIKMDVPHQMTAPAQGFLMNLRRKQFQDVRVREALNLAFDFEDINKTLMYNSYTRTKSYFDNSVLASSGVPKGAELALLEKHRADLAPRIFTDEYIQPSSEAPGGIRSNLRKASVLLKEAGFVVKDGILRHKKDDNALSIELLLVQSSSQPHALAYSKNLERLGIRLKVRTVDVTQYIERLRKFDFDMIIWVYGQSLSPGNEQRDMWSSAAAESEGSRNYAGIQNPVVDDLIEELIKAPDRAALEAATHALDRVLLWNYYMVLMFYSDKNRIAYWDRFGFPLATPLRGNDLTTWWVDAEKDRKLTR